MKRLALLMVAALSVYAQAGEGQGKLAAWFKNGICVRVTTKLVPGGKQIPSGAVVVGVGVRRVLGDGRGGLRFAYDMEAERVGSGFTLRVLPVSPKFAEEVRAGKWSPYYGQPQGNPPTFEVPREIGGIKEGDSVEIELLTNPDTGEKVVDVLRLTLEPHPSIQAPPANDEFFLDRVSIAVRGTSGEQHWAEPAFGLTGAAARVFLPGRGAFYLTLEPRAGFEAAGIAENQRLTFIWNNELFEIVSQSNILRKAPFGRVWIRHDPTYAPRDATRLFLVTADKIDYLLRK